MWNSPGAPYYLERQLKRMRGTPLHSKKAENIRQLIQITRLLGQLCGRYFAATKNAKEGVPLFPKLEYDGIKGTLSECERELTVLHMAAASAEDMLADAYEALKIDPPVRAFTIVADGDQAAPHVHSENGKK
jgi:hypothetical protein